MLTSELLALGVPACCIVVLVQGAKTAGLGPTSWKPSGIHGLVLSEVLLLTAVKTTLINRTLEVAEPSRRQRLFAARSRKIILRWHFSLARSDAAGQGWNKHTRGLALGDMVLCHALLRLCYLVCHGRG